ncbi:hypothetical protein AGLY_009296 [Aphis glycines]|uniref:Uncharacterized protein n=1 Tax=Aphis glycines TaxID=307491 RepID=A0A6G0THZ9_APHGL|nr:hypothetical protein AGLY_009296 [Aphis glycines]
MNNLIYTAHISKKYPMKKKNNIPASIKIENDSSEPVEDLFVDLYDSKYWHGYMLCSWTSLKFRYILNCVDDLKMDGNRRVFIIDNQLKRCTRNIDWSDGLFKILTTGLAIKFTSPVKDRKESNYIFGNIGSRKIGHNNLNDEKKNCNFNTYRKKKLNDIQHFVKKVCYKGQTNF